MQRIPRIDEANASAKTAGLLATVRKQMGGVPNIIGTMAQSSAALTGFIGLSGALAGGTFGHAEREQIALAVAGANRCDYCASAHSMLGGNAGLAAEEIDRNLQGRSADPRMQAALRFASRIVTTRGQVTDDDLAAVRAAGFEDGQVVEILANTVLNIFTNYLNHAAATEIDFPVVLTGTATAA
ncbi:MAG: carboxymuconolactone decarboxylase family protein [Thalassobaculum sp.]|uniref:carboxymuconolactone decarboxylase family protein n=1 Tax=Thalassobaculum sp. TaxID=2022740 RepID=UPI0032EED032